MTGPVRAHIHLTSSTKPTEGEQGFLTAVKMVNSIIKGGKEPRGLSEPSTFRPLLTNKEETARWAIELHSDRPAS